MLMTPKEAKGKWCPFSRVEAPEGSANRVQKLDAEGYPVGVLGSTCIADKCMAWQWRYSGEDGYCGLVRRA